MKILVFCQYYYPEQFLITDIAEELVKRGHDVTVLTGLPNYPSGVIDQEYRNGKRREEVINGVRVIRCPIIPRGRSKLQLLLNYVSYMILAAKKSRRLKEPFDIVFLYQMTPITQALPAHLYCRRNRVKLFMYNCDLAPMCGGGFLGNKGLLRAMYAWFSRKAMNWCDYIAVTSKSFIEYNHVINGVPLDKMMYLPQHAFDEMLDMDMTAQKNDIVDFMFAGNIAGGTNIETIVQTAKVLSRDKQFIVHIVGSGSKLGELKELVKNEGLDAFFCFHGRHSMSEMPEFYKKADALLITLRPGQITVPSKLQTYMTTGKPIFGAMDGSGKEVIEEAKCGKCVFAGDFEGLAKIMKEYIEYPHEFDACGLNGRNFFKSNFTKEKYMERLLGILNNMIGERR